MKDTIKELSITEVFGMTVIFVLTTSIIIFLSVLTYYFAKHANLI